MKHLIQDRSRLAFWICILLLAFCLLTVLGYLASERFTVVTDEYAGGSLGMVLVDILDEDAASSYHVDRLGVYVLAVQEDSEAFRAGIRSGDRMVSVDGLPIDTSSEFTQLQAGFVPLQLLSLAFERGREAEPLLVQLSWNAE